MTSTTVPPPNVTASLPSSSISVNIPSLINNTKIDAENLLHVENPVCPQMNFPFLIFQTHPPYGQEAQPTNGSPPTPSFPPSSKYSKPTEIKSVPSLLHSGQGGQGLLLTRWYI
ncbi:hypothetical protein PAXRUDRAFT_18042 [Paxillus rubicundulus Ve08.2h10]|uniref:Unplaced genomic scaffold scaffold_2541, whole genome shotgun sequence n=1 Tax=Paxillus rubicundulus Ve08.2h10 TaxID=930991 RepID=A0A0D0CMW6_9AGAM|nr:hypothetical protein PAXRUDRAFT_18042 [Paxillus rubicundulus Ve08.2h10]